MYGVDSSQGNLSTVYEVARSRDKRSFARVFVHAGIGVFGDGMCRSMFPMAKALLMPLIPSRSSLSSWRIRTAHRRGRLDTRRVGRTLESCKRGALISPGVQTIKLSVAE